MNVWACTFGEIAACKATSAHLQPDLGRVERYCDALSNAPRYSSADKFHSDSRSAVISRC